MCIASTLIALEIAIGIPSATTMISTRCLRSEHPCDQGGATHSKNIKPILISYKNCDAARDVILTIVKKLLTQGLEPQTSYLQAS